MSIDAMQTRDKNNYRTLKPSTVKALKFAESYGMSQIRFRRLAIDGAPRPPGTYTGRLSSSGENKSNFPRILTPYFAPLGSSVRIVNCEFSDVSPGQAGIVRDVLPHGYGVEVTLKEKDGERTRVVFVESHNIEPASVVAPIVTKG